MPCCLAGARALTGTIIFGTEIRTLLPLLKVFFDALRFAKQVRNVVVIGFHESSQQPHVLFELFAEFFVLLITPGITDGRQLICQRGRLFQQPFVEFLQCLSKLSELHRVNDCLSHLTTSSGFLVITECHSHAATGMTQGVADLLVRTQTAEQVCDLKRGNRDVFLIACDQVSAGTPIPLCPVTEYDFQSVVSTGIHRRFHT